jgi:acyl carrier protein
MLEEAFGIELTETEMAELDRLSAIVALVEQRRAA